MKLILEIDDNNAVAADEAVHSIEEWNKPLLYWSDGGNVIRELPIKRVTVISVQKADE